MMRLLAAVVMLFLCAMAPASASTALAPPAVVDSSPRAGSTVPVAPQYVRLTFDRPVARGGPYTVNVTKDGEVWSESMIGADETVMTIPLRNSMPVGEYVVSYEVTPPDGAVARGEYKFSVSAPFTAPVWVWFLVAAAVMGTLVTAYRLARR